MAKYEAVTEALRLAAKETEHLRRMGTNSVMADGKSDTTSYANDPRVDAVAKAIAWTELTEKGRCEAVWPDEWSEREVARFRLMAMAAMEALHYGTGGGNPK